MTNHDAIKHLSHKISYAKECGDRYIDCVNVNALEIAVRAMAKEDKRVIYAEELKHILNNSIYYGTKAGNDFADMIVECETIKGKKQ